MLSTANVRAFTSLVGATFLLYTAYTLAKLIWHFARPSRLHLYCHPRSWALVTGASDGIGLAFAHELLQREINVLLHGRNEEKLKRLQTELRERYPRSSIEFVIADASEYGDAYMKVVGKVQRLPGKLTMLINNVGGVHTSPAYVAHTEITHEAIDTSINTNSRFATHLTKELIPILQQNGPSLLANLGSVGALVGVPYIITYTANKGYIHAYTEGLKNELATEGMNNIDVLGWIVGNTASNTNEGDVPLTIDSRQCAASCLDKAGYDTDALVWGHWKYWLQHAPLAILPKGLARRLMADSMKGRLEKATREHKRKTG